MSEEEMRRTWFLGNIQGTHLAVVLRFLRRLGCSTWVESGIPLEARTDGLCWQKGCHAGANDWEGDEFVGVKLGRKMNGSERRERVEKNNLPRFYRMGKPQESGC